MNELCLPQRQQIGLQLINKGTTFQPKMTQGLQDLVG